MNHIDEHTIEMYVLGSELVTERRGEIEAHFKECHGCRTLAEQMEQFYKQAEGFLLTSLNYAEGNIQQSKALARVNKAIEPYDEPFAPTIPYRPNTPLAKMFYFIRRHPVVVGASGFAMVAAMGWFLNDAIRNFSSDKVIKDKNPSYAHINSNSAVIEIYNQQNQLLWGIPSKSIYNIAPKELAESRQKVVVADIDGDKRNEVLTIFPLGNTSEVATPLSIFSSEGKLIREIQFNEEIQFRGTKYDGRLGPSSFVCDDFQKSDKKEIFVVTNNGRSPNIIHRLSSDGTILGQYFHFGYGEIASIQMGDERKIVFIGQNDVGEQDSLSYAVMSVLNPSKIVGKTEASESRGFGLSVSNAEMYVIRFPLSDMNILWNTLNYARNLNETVTSKRKTYSVWICGTFGNNGLASGDHPIFEYIFDEHMEIIEVKYYSETLRLRQDFMNQGKLHGTFDQAYLENLKNGVRYWNGKGWQKEPTIVKHDGGNVAKR